MLRGFTKPAEPGLGIAVSSKNLRRMASGGNLLDALPKRARTAADVEYLGLIQRNFDGARSDVICCRVNVCKGCVHRLFPPPPWGRWLLG